MNPPDDGTGSEGSSRDSVFEDPRVARAVEEYLAAERAGRRPARDQFLARHPEIAAELAECLDGLAFITGAAPRLRRLESDEPGHADPPPADPLGDFRIVREIGRGGMGVVYEAEQLSLARRVALKVLPFAAALDPKQLRRFRNEALAAAHLNHPHIVPVYGVGCERGVHYYAMQFIDGQTLAALIGSLRAAARRSGTGKSAAAPETPPVRAAGLSTEPSHRSASFVRSVAAVGVQAAEALEHAHQMGVVHRDVKPANLMVDARGHLWVADFGLAQFRGGADLTLTGDVVGTLRYMAPEQALSRHDLVDHRADVYALGVTLYELLTLRPAVDGKDRQEVLRRLLEGGTPNPRRVNPAVPTDLETVLLKATAHEPESRYATAQEFADDLKRFLDGHPVAARRPGLARRAAGWARRHRQIVVAAAVALALTVVGLTAGLAYVSAEREEASRQRDLARRAVDDMYTGVAERWLDQEPGLEEVQRDFLLKALAYYREFARKEGRRPDVQFAAAMAHRRVGDIYQKLEDGPAAESAYTDAIRLLDRLAADHPGRAEYTEALAHCHQNRGELMFRSKRHSDAEAEYQRAIELRERLADGSPPASPRRYDLAVSLGASGQMLHFSGRTADAERDYRRAIDLLKALVAERRDPAALNQLGVILGRLAELVGGAGDRRQARKLLEQAVKHLRVAVKTSPRHNAGRDHLAGALVHLARTLARLGDTGAAEGAYHESLDLRERLADDFPRTPRHRHELAIVRVELGDLAVRRGDPMGEGQYDLAVILLGQLIDECPETPAYARDLAWLLATCPDPRVRDADRAVTLARRATELSPKGGDCWRTFAAALCRSGDWAGAVEAVRKAMVLRGGGDGREWLLLALAHGRLGDRAKARDWYDKAVKWIDTAGPCDGGLCVLRAEAEAVAAKKERPRNE